MVWGVGNIMNRDKKQNGQKHLNTHKIAKMLIEQHFPSISPIFSDFSPVPKPTSRYLKYNVVPISPEYLKYALQNRGLATIFLAFVKGKTMVRNPKNIVDIPEN
jgi:hypothetical protein